MKKLYLMLLTAIGSWVANAQQENSSLNLKSSKISFTENKGQVADQVGQVRSDVRFTVATGGIKIFIAENGLHYQWQKVEGAADANADISKMKSESYRVDVNLLNALSSPEVIMEGPSDYYTNYYLAHCPQGITHVRNYNKVTLRNIYRNIDWVFYIKGGDVEYDFLVHPGGNPADIAMQIEGATDLKISETGSLVLTSPLGSCEQLAPVAFQNGKPLDSKFVLKDNILRLEVDDYNPALALNIDPVIKVWGTYYGGTGDETVTDLKTDNAGNVYMAGYTTSTSNITSGAHQTSFGGGNTDGFLVKFDDSGNRLWGTYYGGDSTDMIYGCATDASGNVFISGTTMSATGIAFNGFKNSINIHPPYDYGSDAFLVKFNSSGVRQWGTYLGGTNLRFDNPSGHYVYYDAPDNGYGCATDLNGNVYLCGTSYPITHFCYDSVGNPAPCNTVYVATPGAYQDTTGGYDYLNPFLVKFDGNGNRLWGTYYAGADLYSIEEDFVYCATDRSGNVYLAGTTNPHYDGPGLGFNGHQDTARSLNDAWVAKFDPTGATCLWSTYYGGYADERLTGLCTDSTGNVYFSGTTKSTNAGYVIATWGAERTSLSSNKDVFLVKMNSNGVRQWGTYYGDLLSSSEDNAQVTTDNTGRVFLSGYTHLISNTIGYCGYNEGWPGAGMWVARFRSVGTVEWAESFIQDNQSAYNTEAAYCATIPSGKKIYLASYNNYVPYSSVIPLNGFQSAINGGYDAALVCFVDSAIYDTICGYVFDDTNGNGVQDFGEGFLNNIRVYMTVQDQNYQAYTNASGYYQLIILKWGQIGYCVSDLYLSVPSGKVVSIPLAGKYPSTVLGNSPGCIYNFGLSPSISVSGKIYYDTNRGGTLTSGEPGIPIQSVSFNSQRQSYTDGNGDYTAIIPVGNYTETFDKLDAYSTSTSNPANYTINGTTPGSTYTSKNFGAYFTPSFINSAVNIWQCGLPPVVGQLCTWWTRVTNVGTLPSTDTLVFHYDSLLVYTGNSNNLDTLAHTITIITNNIVPARYSDYNFTFLVPSTIPPGTILNNWAWVSPTIQPDTNLINNRDDDYREVLASYDPNNKVAETNTANPSEHMARYWSNDDDYIRYVINFQNTGTYTAFNVIINDTLPVQLDPSTVQVIKSSHACVVNRSGQTLNFKFSSINLPDSASNESGSKGYVVFRVKPAISSYPGDSIVNHAAIYFDYNSAVLTDNNVVQLISGEGPCTAFITTHKYDTVCTFTHPYIFEGQSLTEAGTYTGDTVTMALGCDSVTILHLFYRINIPSYTSAGFCSLGGTVFNGQIITMPGLYRDTILKSNGCDSIIGRNFSSSSALSTYYKDTMCTVEPFHFNDTTFTWPGYNPVFAIRLLDTLVSVGGCDSFVWLDLYWRVKTRTIRDTICGFEPYVIGNDTFYPKDYFVNYSRSGNYFSVYIRDTLQTLEGCDSIVTLRLYIEVSSYDIRYTYVYGSNPCGTSGNAAFSPPYATPGLNFSQTNNPLGCPDVLIFKYSLPIMSYMREEICPGDSFYFNGQWRKTQRYYYDTLQAVCGDDSVVALYLSLNSTDYVYAATQALCPDSSFTFRGVTYDQPGYYIQEDSSEGCPDTTYRIWLYETYEFDTVSTYAVCPGSRFSYQDTSIIFQQPFSYYDSVSYWNICTDSFDSRIDAIRRLDIVADTACKLMAEFDSVRFPNCQVPYDGYLHLRVWGGTPPFTYRWSTSDTSIYLSDLTYGYYGVTVYDALGDSAIPYLAFINGSAIYLQNSILGFWGGAFFQSVTFDSIPYLGYTIDHPSLCFEETGTVNLSISWYGGPFIISDGNWSDTAYNGYYYQNAYLPLTSLGAGHHSLTITNFFGCTYPFDLYIPGDKMEFVNVPSTLCSDTAFNVIVKYNDYNWNDPLIQLDIQGFDSILTYHSFDDSDTLYNLSSGYHYYSVTNTNGCTKTDSFYIPFSVSGLAVSLSDYPTTSCGNQHLLTASAHSGVPPYNFLWNTSETNDTIAISQPGSYSVRVSDATGCSITNSVAIQPATVITNSIAVSICSNESYNFNNTPITTAGIYTHTLQTISGCDSIITLTLSTLPLSSNSLSASICQGNAYNFNGQSLTQDGIYSASLTNSSGCDSIITLALSTLPLSSNSLSASICQGDAYNFNGQSLTQAGFYSAILANSKGCDSTVTLSLSVLTNSRSSLSVNVCADTSYDFHGQILTQSGTYSASLTNGNGCDSTVTLSLSMLPNATSSSSLSICADSSYNFHGQVITQTGTYTALLIAGNGCDSVATLNFTSLTPMVPSITRVADTLFASAASNYQWYLGNNPVSGSTGNFLVITQNGQYRVAVIDANGCSETSAAVNVTGVGIADIEKDFFARVFPNPATQQIIIESNFIKPLISIQSLQGQLISEFYAVKPSTRVDISALAPAVYLVKIMSTERVITVKFLKE